MLPIRRHSPLHLPLFTMKLYFSNAGETLIDTLMAVCVGIEIPCSQLCFVAKPPNLFRFVFNRNRTHSLCSVARVFIFHSLRSDAVPGGRPPRPIPRERKRTHTQASIKDAPEHVLLLKSAAMPDARRNSHYMIIIYAHKVGCWHR